MHGARIETAVAIDGVYLQTTENNKYTYTHHTTQHTLARVTDVTAARPVSGTFLAYLSLLAMVVTAHFRPSNTVNYALFTRTIAHTHTTGRTRDGTSAEGNKGS